MPEYRPRHVSQIDGSRLQWANCTMASGATAIDRHTRGQVRTTGAKLRSCQFDQRGGTDLIDLRTAWSRCFKRYLDVRLKTKWSTFVGAVKGHRGAVLVGWYSLLPRQYRAQDRANFGHAVYINEFRASDGAGLMYDPLRKAPIWVPQIYLKRFAGYFRTSRGRLGLGYAQYGLTKVTATVPVPKPPSSGTNITLRYGGVKIARVTKVTTVQAKQRRSPYIRTDNVIKVVPRGTKFVAYQKTTKGTNVGGSSTWYGNSTGTVWMHASVVKNA